jgi:hypothetical protein
MKKVHEFTARAVPLWTLPRRSLEAIGHKTTRLGERLGNDRLVYNPITMWTYHRLALQDAAGVACALLDVFPTYKRFADIGAGGGAFAAALRRRGVDAVAYERSRTGRLIGRLYGAVTCDFDLERQAAPPDVDLAYSFEVGEHLAPELGLELIAYLTSCAPVIVFTAAQPGQGGYGHVNEQPRSYWEAMFADRQYVPWPDARDALKRAFGRQAVGGQWFYDNLSVFCRNGPRP